MEDLVINARLGKIGGGVAILSLVCLAATACADQARPNFRGVPAEAQPVSIHVENQHFQDVVVYVSRSGAWQRVGQVTGTMDGRMEVPEYLTESASQFRVRVHAIGSSDSGDYVTESIVINPGEELRITVRSVINMSSWFIR